ncbi:MAG: tail fiber domain-containing protein [Terracidiphilus sp.]
MKNFRTAILAVCMATLGSLALQAQTNTASGDYALSDDTSGAYNTAYGYYTLTNASTGSYNSGFGAQALSGSWDDWYYGKKLTGSYNSAFGVDSLQMDLNGSENSAFGFRSLRYNTSGIQNTAGGVNALLDNTSGSENTAFGYDSLYSDNNGWQNAAFGHYALYSNQGGNYNTASGAFALGNNATGNYNVGIGYAAGYNLSAGATNNVDILSRGVVGDNNIIRIGNSTHTAFYAAGVYEAPPEAGVGNALPVLIDSNGKMYTASSSIRFKEDVHDMAAASDGLMRLRPVTYRYKKPYADGSKPIDYGLIAEEVAEVYPDLVVKNADGQIQTVQYQKLTPMLLNEVQKQHRLLEEQAKTIQLLEKQGDTVARQEETIQQLEKQLAALPLLEKRLAALEAAQPSTTLLESRLEKK